MGTGTPVPRFAGSLFQLLEISDTYPKSNFQEIGVQKQIFKKNSSDRVGIVYVFSLTGSNFLSLYFNRIKFREIKFREVKKSGKNREIFWI